MLDLFKVTEILDPYFKAHEELSLYNVEWANEFGYTILRVSVDKIGGINSDELALVNDYLSEKLDAFESELPDNYMLEVCSPGAEKELRNKEEVLNSIGEKVNVTLDNEVYEGKLISFIADILLISINVKGRIKKVEINFNDVKKIRLAV